LKSRRRKIELSAVLIILFAVTLPGHSGYAQQTYWQRQADPQMVVIPVRSMQDITSDLENAIAVKQLAVSRNSQAVVRLRDIASSIKDREALIQDLDRRRDEAKDNNRKSEETSLKIESEANEKAIKLLERLRDLRKAEIDEAEVGEERADLTIRVFQLESELQGRRSEYNWQSSGSQTQLTHNTAYKVISELEVELLQLQMELAKSTQELASKQKDVVNRRTKLHEAQQELGI